MTVLTEKPTLYVVSRRNDLIKKYGHSFHIVDSLNQEVKKKVPAIGIRDIVVHGDVHLDAEVLALAEKQAIPVHFLSKGGRFRASLMFDYSNNVYLRYQQFKMFEQTSLRLNLAKKFVEAKIFNHNHLFKRMKSASLIDCDCSAVDSLDELRGKEGAAARQYFFLWRTQGLIKNSDFSFERRSKNPPQDPINALLSYCYTLLHAEIHTQLLIAGLDPYIGYLHDQSYGHAALASDFIEIYRAPVDHFVLKRINRREFDVKEDFMKEPGGAVRMSKSGYAKFFPKWSEFLRKEKFYAEKNLTQLIERDVRKLNHFLMQDSDEFAPFYWGQL